MGISKKIKRWTLWKTIIPDSISLTVSSPMDSSRMASSLIISSLMARCLISPLPLPAKEWL